MGWVGSGSFIRLVTVGLFAVAVLRGVTATPLVQAESTDVEADRAMAIAAWDGSGAHVPVSELAGGASSGLPELFDAPAARTPGALVLASPWVFVPEGQVVRVMKAVSVVSLVVVCGVGARVGGLPLWTGALLALLLADTGVMRSQYTSGNSAVLVAVAIAVGWWAMPSRLSGILIGAALVVKLWPALIVACLLARRDTRRVGWWAIWSATFLNLVGLLLPGSSLAGSAASIVEGISYSELGGNVSAASALGVPIWFGLILGGAVAALGMALDRDLRISASVAGGLIACPVVWPYYWIAFVPAAQVICGRIVRNRIRLGEPAFEQADKSHEQDGAAAVVDRGPAMERSATGVLCVQLSSNNDSINQSPGD